MAKTRREVELRCRPAPWFKIIWWLAMALYRLRLVDSTDSVAALVTRFGVYIRIESGAWRLGGGGRLRVRLFPREKTVGMTSPHLAGQPFRIMDDVIKVSRGSSLGVDHPAVFSVHLVDAFLRCWLGDIYDPFLGSGTTLIAAEQLGRRCFGMEIEPRYCDVIVKRWENFTGRQAHRETS